LGLSLIDDDPIKPLIFITGVEKKEYKKTPKPNSFLSIFLISKLVYNEAFAVAYGKNTFRFDTIQALSFFTRSCKAAPRLMTKVELVSTTCGQYRGMTDLWALLHPLQNSKISPTFGFMTSAECGLYHVLNRMPLLSHLKVRVTVFQQILPDPAAMPYVVMLLTNPYATRHQIQFDFLNPSYTGRSTKHLRTLTFIQKEVRGSLIASLYAFAFIMRCMNKLWAKRSRRKSARLQGEPSFGQC
jgi:hypothetical protein